jgi:DNA-binding transcriptional MerR regulator
MRIGEVAERVGVTQRTIRYYEERGLLGHGGDGRTKGTHRVYTEADVARLQELLRLRDLLALTLEDLAELAEAEEARAALRGEWEESTSDAQRLRIVDASTALLEQQLELVRSRREKLDAFADELETKLARLQQRRDELSAGSGTRARRAARTNP